MDAAGYLRAELRLLDRLIADLEGAAGPTGGIDLGGLKDLRAHVARELSETGEGIMDKNAPSQDVAPSVGVVSYAEVGDVAFAFLALHSQAERIVKAIAEGESDGVVTDLLNGLNSTLKSSKGYIAPARRMAGWARS